MTHLTRTQIQTFRRKILRFYALHGRKLPFRQTTDPYKITVAEIMLQQTQVERVLPKYESWIARWPDWNSLARATNRQLLTAWSGLGYNRRCLFLGRLAHAVVSDFGGVLPANAAVLSGLPGLGPYTSRAILIFAFNLPLVTIDTNIRRVLLHEFGLPATTHRKALEDLAFELLPKKRSRDWHNALMDYSVLVLPKRLGDVPPVSRQSRFKGSHRQIRGEIVRRLTTQRSVTVGRIAGALNRTLEEVHAAARSLEKDGVVKMRGTLIRLTDISER